MHSCRKRGSSRLCAFSGLCQGQNHRWPLHLNLGKPSKNHRFQWLICKKTFNGDGPGKVKPLKNHRWQWCLGKKTLPSHRYKKMTIVEVYAKYFFEKSIDKDRVSSGLFIYHAKKLSGIIEITAKLNIFHSCFEFVGLIYTSHRASEEFVGTDCFQ